jgi:hypothetical protein
MLIFNLGQKLIVGAAVFICLLTIFFAFNSGKNRAQSKYVSQNAESLASGLDYFFQDQGRFPTAVEFSNPNIMRDYYSAYPVEDLVSKACPQCFLYQ